MSGGSEFEAFLAAARAEHARETTPEYAERMEASLGARVSWRRRLPSGAAADLAAGTAKSPALASPARGHSVGWIKIFAFGAPIVGISLIGYLAASSPSPPAAVGAPALSPSASVPVAPEISPPSADLAPPSTVGPAELPDAKGERPSRAAVASAARTKDDGSLEAELALLRQVTGALQTNHPARALALLDEHGRRFPRGELVPEFAGQRVLALAALGRRAEACEQSSAFLAKYPKSPLASQVRTSCESP